ncbi:MAG: hypothetical protein ACQERE_09380 [Pseudomonadota bacterium]
MLSNLTPYPSPTTTTLKGLALAASLAITGCMGGGGSSSSDSGDTASTAACGATEVRNLLVDESGSHNEDLSLCFSADNAGIEADGHVSDLEWDGNKLAFSTNQVDRPRSTEIRILDPDGATQVRINVVVENASGRADEVRAAHIVNNSDAIRALENDRRIYAYTLETAYLDGQISWSERQSMLARWTPETTQSHDILSSRIKETEEVLEAYRNGEVGEQRLAEAADNAVDYLPSHGDYGAQKLEQLARDDRIDVTVPDVSFGVLTYRSSVEQVSRRVGNRAYGELEQGQWEFDDRYRFLSAVENLETNS